MYVRVTEACSHLKLAPNTVRKYCDRGILESKRTDGGHRLVKIDKRPKNAGRKSTKISEGKDYVYVRVSTYKQKDDLLRQKHTLSERFPNHEIVSDIGSGLNWKRKGLLSLLEKAQAGLVRTVVVSHRDRLCRIGFELLKWLLVSNGAKIMVLKQPTQEPDKELNDDILAILHVFSCRQNSRRRYKSTITNKEDKITIDITTKENL